MMPRQVAAWKRAWASDLIPYVEEYEPGLYSVPSQRVDDQYTVERFDLAHNGFFYFCSCPASVRGGVVCAHICAVHLWRLERKMHCRLKNPHTGETLPNWRP